LARVKTDVEKARKSCTDAETGLATETAKRQQESDDTSCDTERETLQGKKADLQEEIRRLLTAETSATDSVSNKGVQQLQAELAGFREQAVQWTDNTYVLEEYLRRLAGGNWDLVEAILRECYGDEYVNGEGLREL
jgi:hypothetical protein